jgi:hypothetical protein
MEKIVTRECEKEEVETIRASHDKMMIYCALVLQGERDLTEEYIKSFSEYQLAFNNISNKYKIYDGSLHFDSKILSGKELITNSLIDSKIFIEIEAYRFLLKNHIDEDKESIEFFVEKILELL